MTFPSSSRKRDKTPTLLELLVSREGFDSSTIGSGLGAGSNKGPKEVHFLFLSQEDGLGVGGAFLNIFLIMLGKPGKPDF